MRPDADLPSDRAPQLVSRKRAAAILAIGLSSLDSLCREGALRSVKCRGRRLIDVSSLHGYVAQHSSGPAIDAGDGLLYLTQSGASIKPDQFGTEDDGTVDLHLRSKPKLSQAQAVRLACMLLDFLVAGQDEPTTSVRRPKERDANRQSVTTKRLP